MSYRPRPIFDQPTAETIQRSRRTIVWFIPLIILQQGSTIFRHGSDFGSRLLATLAWASVSLMMLWMLLNWPMRWLSERDQAVLNDERSRAISGDAARWGIVAVSIIGCAMMVARLWISLDAGLAIYGLVNGALVVAVIRYAWLNRPEPDENE